MTVNSNPEETILDRLSIHAKRQPDQVAFRYLRDDAGTDTLTFGQLDRRSRGLAGRLREHANPGDRALLLYPAGLEFIEAFLACLAAGIVAVPAYPPRRARNAERLRAIAQDSQPRLALTTRPLLSAVRASELASAHGLTCLATDDLGDESRGSGPLPSIAGDMLAFLQYTSGSTGTPRGIAISHDNLIANERAIAIAYEHTQQSVSVGWLPAFHDMGLIGNILQPAHVGYLSVLLSPSSFMREPARWLRAISRYRATTSGAPNFAYDYCVRGIPEEQKEGLNLESWSVAYNGAEPIRAETLARFVAAYSGHGFRRESFFPCYGLAEATLFVSGGPVLRGPTLISTSKSSLEAGRVEVSAVIGSEGRCLVSSGRPARGTTVLAVDPVARVAVDDGLVGEIWISSLSVASGYWNQGELSRRTFGNYLSDGQGPFLNSGDLGFLEGGEVFITGRSKDLIIVRGRNIYPQDVEAAVERQLSGLRPSACVAFGVEGNDQERLVVVIEAHHELMQSARRLTDNQPDRKCPAIDNVWEAIDKVCHAVMTESEITVQSVVFVRPGTFPRTSSGKVQRRAAQAAYLAGTLNAVFSWEAS